MIRNLLATTAIATLVATGAFAQDATTPVALPIKGFAQAEYRRQFDLMPGGRQFVVLIPGR